MYIVLLSYLKKMGIHAHVNNSPLILCFTCLILQYVQTFYKDCINAIITNISNRHFCVYPGISLYEYIWI